jgi:hypothetical protein
VTGWRKKQIKEHEMTDKEAMKLALDWFKCYADGSMSRNNAEALADEVVEALKERLAQPEQEPVAWVNKERNTITWDKLYPDMDALYTTPPKGTK